MKKLTLTVLFIPLSMLGILSENNIFAKDYEPDSKTSFVLIKPLTIKSGTASVFIQKDVATRNEALIDQYYPNCHFEQPDLATTNLVIELDEFIVTNTRFSRDPATRGSYEIITLFYLTAIKSKKKYTLECQYWGDWSDRYLTREQVQNTVKTYFKIIP